MTYYLTDISSQIIFAFFATFAFALIFDVPKKELIFCGIIGAVGQTVYFIMKNNGTDILLQFSIPAVIVTLLSRLLSNRRCMPVTIYLICGMIPLVPGAGIYYTIYYIISQDNYQSAIYGIDTFKSAVAISVAIIVIFSLPQNLFGKKIKRIK